MKALIWDIDGQLKTIERELPPLNDGDAVVKVEAVGICGSDITIKNGHHPRAKAPLILGHEFSGTLARLPASGRPGFAVGDRVVIEPLVACGQCAPCLNGFEHVCESLKLLGVETDGGFAQFARVPKACIHKLPESISFVEGAVLEPFAVGVHSVNAANMKPKDRVAIFGAGPIGLMIALACRAAGNSPLVIFEINEFRRSLAEKLGFKTVNSAETDVLVCAAEMTNGKGFDVVFDAAGVPPVGEKLLQVAAIKGRIMMTALYKKPCSMLFRDMSYREQEIKGLRIYARGDFAQAIQLVADRKVDLKPLISSVFPFSEVQDAFVAAETGKETCKIVVTMNESR
jgi:(R,R)-butanediol dehydrogenase / meso-butanediol dehydrogenase / diacetyl reductase